MYASRKKNATDPNAEGPSKLVTAKAPVDLVDRLRQIAEDNDRSFSAEVRRAMRDYIDAYEREAA